MFQVGTNRALGASEHERDRPSMGQPGFLADLPIHGGMLQHHEGIEVFSFILVTEELPQGIFSFDREKSLIQSLGYNLTDLNGLSHRSTTLNTLKVDS